MWDVTGVMNCFIAKLKADFAMKDLGPLGYFLGIQATRDCNGLHLRQTKYVLDLLKRIGALKCPDLMVNF